MTVVDRDQAIAAIGKQAGAPLDVSVRFELTGQLARRINVAVSDRARVVVSLTGDPTVTLTLAGARCMRMAGGRLSPGADTGARIDGDAALGEQVRAHLAFMI